MSRASKHFQPMQIANIEHFVNREYQQVDPYQWRREVVKNAIEAGATTIKIGVEEQGVTNSKTWRTLILDDGVGMTQHQLESYWNTLGMGAKPIGAVHENYGIGARVTLMPWNKAGIVIVSRTSEGDAMIWGLLDPATGQYGLRRFTILQDGQSHETPAVMPYAQAVHNDGTGVDWDKVLPPRWRHGTAIVLLGNNPNYTDDTVMGDPAHGERIHHAPLVYLNTRFWQMPEGVRLEIQIISSLNKMGTFNDDGSERTRPWTFQHDGYKGGASRRVTIHGANHYIHYKRKVALTEDSTQRIAGKLAKEGSMVLSDGTKLEWYLWEGLLPEQNSTGFPQKAFVAARYDNELYERTDHHNRYKTFGISTPAVSRRLFIIVEPPVFDVKTRQGVHPDSARRTLIMHGSGGERALPWGKWGDEFIAQIPDDVRRALDEVHLGAMTATADWRDELHAMFDKMWTQPKPRTPRVKADDIADAAADPDVPRESWAWPELGPDELLSEKPPRPKRENPFADTVRALHRPMMPAIGVMGAEEFDGQALHAVKYSAKDPSYPEGLVKINRDHEFVRTLVRQFTQQMPQVDSALIAQIVPEVIGHAIATKIFHMNRLRSKVHPPSDLDTVLDDGLALTFAISGYYALLPLLKMEIERRATRPLAPALPDNVVVLAPSVESPYAQGGT